MYNCTLKWCKKGKIINFGFVFVCFLFLLFFSRLHSVWYSEFEYGTAYCTKNAWIKTIRYHKRKQQQKNHNHPIALRLQLCWMMKIFHSSWFLVHLYCCWVLSVRTIRHEFKLDDILMIWGSNKLIWTMNNQTKLSAKTNDG